MFLDNECAAYLSESPLKGTLGITERIFSLNSVDDFVAYLDSLSDSTPEEIRESVKEIYGID
jgi:hypothetical protein